MADTLTVELDDKGNIQKLPEPLQKFFDGRINDAVRRKAEQLEAEYKPKLADPATIEKLKTLEEENNRFKEQKARDEKNYEEADRLKEERHKKALEERDTTLKAKDTEITRRDERLRNMLGAEIRAAATAAGARTESLPELVKLLGADLDLDEKTLEPFVKGKDGKPATDKDGKPITIEGFVTQYLTDHPHHIGKAPGKSGRAPGGATFRRAPSNADLDKQSAIEAVEENPSTKTVANAVGVIRRRAG